MKKKSFIIKFLIYAICVVVLFQQMGLRYQEAASHNIINAFTQKRFEDFYALPQNSLNMVFIGSSHS